jgi:hypothetical protein
MYEKDRSCLNSGATARRCFRFEPILPVLLRSIQYFSVNLAPNMSQFARLSRNRRSCCKYDPHWKMMILPMPTSRRTGYFCGITRLYACLSPFFACLTDRTDRQEGRCRDNRSRRRCQVCPEPACPSCGANRRSPEVNAAGLLHAEACADPGRTAPSAALPGLPVGRPVPALAGVGSAAPIRRRPPRPDSFSSPFGSMGRRLLKPGFPIFSSEKTANLSYLP